MRRRRLPLAGGNLPQSWRLLPSRSVVPVRPWPTVVVPFHRQDSEPEPVAARCGRCSSRRKWAAAPHRGRLL